MGANILEDIFGSLQDSLENGKTLKDFKKDILPALEAKGWYGGRKDIPEDKKKGYLNWRLKMIYQTNMSTSYNAGRYRQMTRSSELRPYWVYSAVMDSRTRQEHKDRHGKAWRCDDPFWSIFYPPNGWRCRCSVYSISELEAKRRGIEIISGIPAECETKEFCPEEWRYNPGEQKWSPDWSSYKYLNSISSKGEKLKELKPSERKTSAMDVIRNKWRTDVAKYELNQSEWNNKIDNIMTENYKPQGYDYLIAADSNIADKVKIDRRLFFNDRKILHSTRDTKPNEKKLKNNNFKDVYNITKAPDYILKDNRDGAYLFIKIINDEAVKIVFKKFNDNSCLTMSTTSIVNKDSLLKGKDYKVIYKNKKD